MIFFPVLLNQAVYANNANTGVILSDDRGNILYSLNPDKELIPASILKILTSLAGLEILGQDYHFTTQYSFDKDSNDLKIKGFGDPLLISEVLMEFARDIILNTGLSKINDIIIDQSYFNAAELIPGRGDSLNPYDAHNGALCANFNTINFKWDSLNRQFVSAEPQTPLLPVFYNQIEKSGLKQDRVILSKQQSDLYFGWLMKYFLARQGIKINGIVRLGSFPPNSPSLFSFKSPFDLQDVVKKLLQYSNNFIANQLLITMGAEMFDEPGTIEKGIVAIQRFSNSRLGIPDIKIYEGSGLSRLNRISPNQMLKILIAFLPYCELLRYTESDFYKTGTLSDVKSRAGYLMGGSQKLYPYVIMLNRSRNGYESVRRDLFRRID